MHGTLLFTGFEPFSTHRTNSSWEAIAPLTGERIAGARVRTLLLPVEYGAAATLLATAVAESAPLAVISLGASTHPVIRLEAAARNHGGRPDTAAAEPPTIAGPGLLPSTLPLRSICRRLRRVGIACRFSADAGDYVCNFLFYTLMKLAAGAMPAGFIHLPPFGVVPPATATHAVRLAAEEAVAVARSASRPSVC